MKHQKILVVLLLALLHFKNQNNGKGIDHEMLHTIFAFKH
jgi:hypothetical protein